MRDTYISGGEQKNGRTDDSQTNTSHIRTLLCGGLHSTNWHHEVGEGALLGKFNQNSTTNDGTGPTYQNRTSSDRE